jgi:transcription elongation factor Elf1
MKLKRCPFCNGHDLVMDLNTVVFWVHCFECGAQGPSSHERSGAAQYWNGDHQYQNRSALVTNRVEGSNRDDLKEIES